MGKITVSFGRAEYAPVPFGDSQSLAYYRPARYEETQTVGNYTTTRGRENVVSRTVREINQSRGCRVLAQEETKRPSIVIYYLDALSAANIRFAEIRWDTTYGIW